MGRQEDEIFVETWHLRRFSRRYAGTLPRGFCGGIAMKRHVVGILLSVLVFGSCVWAVRATKAAALPGADALSAITIAETIPLLTLNLNNHKHPANPILTSGEPEEVV